jgi:hypothetical protein
MAQAIAHEELVTKEGNKMTIIAAVLRSWATSKEPTLQKAFIEYAFGKVPDHIEGKGFTAPIVILRHAHQQPQREAGGRQKYGP